MEEKINTQHLANVNNMIRKNHLSGGKTQI